MRLFQDAVRKGCMLVGRMDSLDRMLIVPTGLYIVSAMWLLWGRYQYNYNDRVYIYVDMGAEIFKCASYCIIIMGIVKTREQHPISSVLGLLITISMMVLFSPGVFEKLFLF